MTYQPSAPCIICSGKAQPGTIALMDYIMDLFPYAGSFGIYNCRNIAGTSTKSKHSCGRAWDCRLATLSNGKANTALGHPIIQFLYKWSTQLGIVEQIYDRVIYDDRTPAGRYYGGVHPHNDHIHITQTQSAATSLTYNLIVSITGIDPRKEGPLSMSLLPIHYGHGYTKPPDDSPLTGDQTYKTQDVILLQNWLKRCGWDGKIDGVYGLGTAEGVKTYAAASGDFDGKIVTGWIWDNIVAKALVPVMESVYERLHSGAEVLDHDHDGRYVKDLTVLR